MEAPCQEQDKGQQSCPMNRRTFLQTAVVATIGATSLPGFAIGPGTPSKLWPIGCFNRPWVKWSYDDALDGIAAAGYKLTGFLTGQKDEAFTSSAATPEYLDR